MDALRAEVQALARDNAANLQKLMEMEQRTRRPWMEIVIHRPTQRNNDRVNQETHGLGSRTPRTFHYDDAFTVMHIHQPTHNC